MKWKKKTKIKPPKTLHFSPTDELYRQHQQRHRSNMARNGLKQNTTRYQSPDRMITLAPYFSIGMRDAIKLPPPEKNSFIPTHIAVPYVDKETEFRLAVSNKRNSCNNTREPFMNRP